MKLRDLINQLEEMIEDGVDEYAEVLIATQENYPLQFEVYGVANPANFEGDDPEEDADWAEAQQDEPVVYICTGDHPSSSPYGPRQAWDAAR